MCVADLLGRGKEVARTARELAEVTGCQKREITRQIERERRAGAPICASCDRRDRGYYLAQDAEELQRYLCRLDRRIGAVQRTRDAMAKAKP